MCLCFFFSAPHSPPLSSYVLVKKKGVTRSQLLCGVFSRIILMFSPPELATQGLYSSLAFLTLRNGQRTPNRTLHRIHVSVFAMIPFIHMAECGSSTLSDVNHEMDL